MTDTTPVTDDDRRRAHAQCDEVEGNPDLYREDAHAIARVIRAHVPAPPKTLADKLREWFNLHHMEHMDSFSALVKRAEAIEKDNDRLSRDREDQEKALVEHGRLLSEARANEASDSMQQQAKAWSDIIEHPVFDGALGQGPGNGLENALHRLDSVQAEVQRLTSERTSKESRTVALPDPADVPEGEAWLIQLYGNGEAVPAFRVQESKYGPGKRWAHYSRWGSSLLFVDDEEVDLVSRLAPKNGAKIGGDVLE